jgi:hypothetical protein
LKQKGHKTNGRKRRAGWINYNTSFYAKEDAMDLSLNKGKGNRPLGRPWRRWEDNNKKDLQEVG